jgi:ribosomal protein L27
MFRQRETKCLDKREQTFRQRGTKVLTEGNKGDTKGNKMFRKRGTKFLDKREQT